jgi:hypothetical protein
MKKQYNIFVCDTCGNESKPLEDKHKIHSGYPYEDGWLYLYTFSFKEKKDTQKTTNDKHFCSAKCVEDFILKQLKKEKECLE